METLGFIGVSRNAHQAHIRPIGGRIGYGADVARGTCGADVADVARISGREARGYAIRARYAHDIRNIRAIRAEYHTTRRTATYDTVTYATVTYGTVGAGKGTPYHGIWPHAVLVLTANASGDFLEMP